MATADDSPMSLIAMAFSSQPERIQFSQIEVLSFFKESSVRVIGELNFSTTFWQCTQRLSVEFEWLRVDARESLRAPPLDALSVRFKDQQPAAVRIACIGILNCFADALKRTVGEHITLMIFHTAFDHLAFSRPAALCPN